MQGILQINNKNVFYPNIETFRLSFIKDICDAFFAFEQFKKCEKHPYRSDNIVTLHADACNFTKSNTLPWEFFTFLKLYK